MPRRRTPAWTLLGVTLLAVAVTAAWRTSDLGRAAADLDHQLAAAKGEGVPTGYPDVVRLAPRLPDDDNAAESYRQAVALFRQASGRHPKPERLMEDLAKGKAKPADLEGSRTDLRAVEPALAQAKEGARRKGLFFDRRWQAGEALNFPEYSGLRDLERALVLRAMTAIDPAAAVEDLRAAARMRAQIASEPVVIAALAGNGIEGDVHRALRFLGRRGGAWPQAVAPVLDDLGPIPALRRSLTFEAVESVHFPDMVKRYGAMSFVAMDGTRTPALMRLMAFGAVRDASQARIVEYWRNAWRRLPQDPTDYRAARAALALPGTKGPSYELLRFLTPVFDTFAVANARAEASRRMTRAALTLWSGTRPILEQDPFGTGPLKFRQDAKGWTLYSVGPDEKDDGGIPLEGSGLKGYDLVIRG